MRVRFYLLKLLLATVLISSLTACHTLTTNQFDRELYLQSFIGQSSQFIYSHLDLTKIGYQSNSEPTLTSHQLSYSIQRQLMIPISVAQFPTAGIGSVPIPSTSQSYDVELQCRIVFQLKDNIATSVTSTGRTC